jgi:hypothetical protein
MSRKRVTIACQGGGSQCAFVAGALKTLLTPRVQDRFQVVGLSLLGDEPSSEQAAPELSVEEVNGSHRSTQA